MWLPFRCTFTLWVGFWYFRWSICTFFSIAMTVEILLAAFIPCLLFCVVVFFYDPVVVTPLLYGFCISCLGSRFAFLHCPCLAYCLCEDVIHVLYFFPLGLFLPVKEWLKTYFSMLKRSEVISPATNAKIFYLSRASFPPFPSLLKFFIKELN